ncbi:hypothetical protein [Changchengzhania lutea]|uniref:hypothetical protein n=1 Tax=Changchengzhania lutea TaxID=2049305 RepID=UPI00115DD4CF|nr:hypothetical protein [Changchengzhania lutea]
MNKIHYLIVLIIFASCKEKNSVNEKYETKVVENKYSILIPESLSKTTGLNRHTTFEYENLKDDFYIILMDESKDGFFKKIERKVYDAAPDINGYYKVVLNHFREETNLKDFQVFDEIFELDKKDKKITFTMTGVDMDDNYHVFYRYSIIESKSRYYQIMSWTNQTSAKKLIYKMSKIINSFQIEEN